MGPLNASEIAEAEVAHLSSAAITKVLDRLKEHRYVRRRASGHDRRQVVVERTTQGETQQCKVFGPVADDGLTLLSTYAPGELQLLMTFLRSMSARADRHAKRLSKPL